MAQPFHFPEANLTLGPPRGFEQDIAQLPVRRTIDGRLTSCWQLTTEEKEEIQRTGKVWLSVWGGTSQPPVQIAAFKHEVVPEA